MKSPSLEAIKEKVVTKYWDMFPIYKSYLPKSIQDEILPHYSKNRSSQEPIISALNNKYLKMKREGKAG